MHALNFFLDQTVTYLMDFLILRPLALVQFACFPDFYPPDPVTTVCETFRLKAQGVLHDPALTASRSERQFQR